VINTLPKNQYMKVQNQVAIIAVCQMINNIVIGRGIVVENLSIPFILATTHLKVQYICMQVCNMLYIRSMKAHIILHDVK